MEETEVKEQEQDWIAKYRAALDAVSKKEPFAPGLGAFLDLLRTHFKLVLRGTSDKLKAALESGKKQVAIRTIEAPIESRQTETPALGEGIGVHEPRI